MIIDLEKLPYCLANWRNRLDLDLELDSECPELRQQVGREIIFAVGTGDGLMIIKGDLFCYERVKPDPELEEQEIFTRIAFKNAISVDVQFPPSPEKEG